MQSGPVEGSVRCREARAKAEEASSIDRVIAEHMEDGPRSRWNKCTSAYSRLPSSADLGKYLAIVACEQ